MVLYYIILHCIILYCIVLYYIVLYYIVYIIYTSPIKFCLVDWKFYEFSSFFWSKDSNGPTVDWWLAQLQIMFGAQTKPSSATFPHPQTGFLQAKTDKW